jgi:DNA-binding NarL/FixJ family response regulator
LAQTHVILVNMPQMLREIVRTVVSDEPDLEIVAEFEDPEAYRTIDEGEPYVFITSLRDGATAVDRFFGAGTKNCVLAVSADGSETALYELRPRVCSLGEISPEMLVAAIRGSASHEGHT